MCESIGPENLLFFSRTISYRLQDETEFNRDESRRDGLCTYSVEHRLSNTLISVLKRYLFQYNLQRIANIIMYASEYEKILCENSIES